jgi:hypothetical protein
MVLSVYDMFKPAGHLKNKTIWTRVRIMKAMMDFFFLAWPKSKLITKFTFNTHPPPTTQHPSPTTQTFKALPGKYEAVFGMQPN